jgi:NAD(P)-dependent dehydrogenase (short-subunit alcohol dehydrogenase family)
MTTKTALTYQVYVTPIIATAAKEFSPGQSRSTWSPIEATFDWLFAANVRAPYFLVGALAPKMAARGGGSIVSIASMAGQVGLASGAAYGATRPRRRR